MTQFQYDINNNGKFIKVFDTNERIENTTLTPPPESMANPCFINGTWVDGNYLKLLSPVEFKMLFTSEERIAIKASTDAVVQDFFELINDPRLTQVDRNLQSVKDAIAYLEFKGLIAVGRSTEILA